MSIDVIRTDPERSTPSTTDRREESRRDRQCSIDVSDVSAATVATYARDAIGTDAVHLERRGGRTFLVAR